MVTIRFFGLIREISGHRQLCVTAGTLRVALAQAAASGVDRKLLREAIVFVNGIALKSARHSCKLRDGDELALLSPMCGG